MIGHLPEDVGVDDADVQQPPEDVLPPPDAGTTNTVVGPQLVEPVHSSHPPVVVLDTGGCRQLDFRVIPPDRLHHVQPLVIGCHNEDVTTVPPLHQHDAVSIRPLHRHSGSQLCICQLLGELTTMCPCRSTKIRAIGKQILRKCHRSKEIICVDVVMLVEMILHQFHDHSVAQVVRLGRRYLSTCTRQSRDSTPSSTHTNTTTLSPT